MSNGKLTRRPLPLLAALLLAAVAALVPGNAVRHHRDLSFDGGFNAQVARTLAEKHRYATTYRGLHDFDHRVQTGPTVIVPTAVVFRLVGVNNATAQLTNLAYLLLLFLLTVVLAWRLSGDLAAFLVIPVLLATPHLFTFGMGLYGEIPALVFLLAAALVLDLSRCGSSWWAAGTTGFLLGLAVLTKFQMVLPVAVMVAVAWILRPRDSGRSLGTLAAAATGFAAALVPMELAKLHTFSWPVYLQWWRDMLGRSFAQGTSFHMARHTIHGPTKPWVHLGILARQTGLPPLLVAFLVILPPLLVVLLLRRRRTAAGSTRADNAALAALAWAGLALVAWWLFLSPTGRAWFRRVMDGVILLEIIGTLTVVEWGRLLCRLPEKPPDRPGTTARSRWFLPVAVILVGQVLSVLVWTRLPRLDRDVRPSRERRATAAMVAAIEALPEDAVIYAKGWYEAPVLAALSGRSFRDLDQFPIDRYRAPLHHTYFIADAAMHRNRPDEVRDVLDRAGAVLVKRAGANTLHQLTELCPYPPIAPPQDPTRLLTVFRPERDPGYPYRGGIGRDPARPREAHVVSGVLLARHGLPCLEIDLTLTNLAGPHPTVIVRLDGATVLEERASAPERFHRTIPLEPETILSSRASHVELALRRNDSPRRFALWYRDWRLYLVNLVGFTSGCTGGAAPTSLTAAPANGTHAGGASADGSVAP